MENPFQSGIDKKKQLDSNIDKNIRKSKTDSRKANAARNKQVLQNASKTIAPILINQLTNTLIQVVNQNGKLQELVNKTNTVIDAAVTPEQIKQAVILRNSAIQIINNQENKVMAMQGVINTINAIIVSLNIVINIASAIFLIPIPPFADIITPIKERLRKIYEKAVLILNALSVALPILSIQLELAINTLEDLKAQLRNVNGLLDDKSINSGLISSIQPSNFGTNFPMYKGFKFALKEENNPKFTVRGNKRHYAVAIDRDGVEVLKSDYSFTLDPNDLIEQLKLTIDNKNLQA